MQNAEKRLREQALREGYEVLHSGWPDFLLVKDGKAIFVEVKGRSNEIQENQFRLLKVLEGLGLYVRIAFEGDLNDLVTLNDPRIRMPSQGSNGSYGTSRIRVVRKPLPLKAGREKGVRRMTNEKMLRIVESVGA